MKKRHFFVPDEDSGALFKDKTPKPEDNIDGSGGVKKTNKVDYDWLMIQKLENTSNDVPFLGKVINDGGPIKHRPINHDPDLKTAILMVPFSPLTQGAVTKVTYTDPTGLAVEVKFTLLAGNYDAFYAQYPAAEIIAEVPGECFSVKTESGEILSYLKTGNENEVVFASYGSSEAFDALGWNFLVRP